MKELLEKAINILVASEDEKECRDIHAILSTQNDFYITRVVNDIAGIIIKSQRLKPDILILDMQIPGINTIEVTQIIHRKSPSTIIIMLCDRNHSNFAELAHRAGISGVLLTKDDLELLVPIIRIIIHGGFYFNTPIAKSIINTAALNKYFPVPPASQNEQNFQAQANNPLYLTYTPTERNIITGIARGLTDEQIANRLNYSKGTIRNYVTAIKRKTKFKNRAQIAVFSLIYKQINFDQLWH